MNLPPHVNALSDGSGFDRLMVETHSRDAGPALGQATVQRLGRVC